MNDAHPADGNEGLLSALFRKLGTRGKRDDDVTGEEIKDMVNEGHEHGVLNENEAEMINNIFEFGEKQTTIFASEALALRTLFSARRLAFLFRV